MSLKSALVGALALTALAAPAAASAASPVGPDPTVSGIRGDGPLPYDKITIADSKTPGFGKAFIYAPKDTSVKYGSVAISPGWTETTSAIHWLGPRLASHGFVVIVFDVTNTFTDLPPQRASQLLRAVDFMNSSASGVASRIDASRSAVMGHSMGGGGALEATLRRPSLKAAVPLMPWSTNTNFKASVVPTLIVGSQNDIIAPVGSHSVPFYNSLSSTAPKAYFEIKGADHFASNSPSPTVSAESVAWLKRFVDEDTRYTQFICPAATGAAAGKQNRYSE